MNPGGTLFHRHLVHSYSALYTFSEFARTGGFLRFRSRVLQDDFYLVAEESLKPGLPNQTLVVYTAGEMKTLLLIDPNAKDLIAIHELKKRFGVTFEN